MNIVVSANNNEEIIVFPVIPRTPMLNNSFENEEFKTVNAGTLNLIGDKGLRAINLSSLFPKKIESWARPGSIEGIRYIEFFQKWIARKVPLRLVISLEDGTEWLNMSCLVESFNYSFDKLENVRYTLDFKEYTFIL